MGIYKFSRVKMDCAHNNIFFIKYCRICLLSSLLLLSCHKQELGKYSYDDASLGFLKKEQGNGIVLSWNQSVSLTFVEYIVTKNTKSTPALTTISDIQRETILARYQNKLATSIADSAVSFPSYYRLYVNYGRQVFVSEEIYHATNNYVLTGNEINQVLVDHRKGKLYTLYSNQNIERIDLKKMELESFFFRKQFFSFRSSSLGYDKDGNTEIYVPEYSRIQFCDGDILNPKSYIQNDFSGVDILSTVTDENSNIFFTDWVTGGLGGISRYDPKTQLKTRTNLCFCSQRNISISSNGKRGLVGSSFGIVNSFTVDDLKNIRWKSASRDSIDWESNKLVTVANKSETIICGRQGLVFKDQFKEQKRLALEVEGYVQSIFDKEEKYIYAIGSVNKAIYKFENKLGYQKVAIIPLKFFPTHIFIYDSWVFVLESIIDPNTGIVSTILEKIGI
jgi:hypothetical protein